MSRTLLLLSLCWGNFLVQWSNGQNSTEKYRLQLHYSVPSGWLNDPNGLVYHNGVFHLFYQHHPASTKWGPMHWGHAQSTDLIRWRNMPVALRPSDKGDIFSGSCVVDSDNVTGLARGPSPNGTKAEPIVALYTLNNKGSQSQALAYSLDDGLSWTQYSGNPVIPNKDLRDFRDPNVIKRNGTFYMALAAGNRIIFYSSQNLKTWNQLRDFGVKPSRGDKSGVWECPTLVSLADERGVKHDVLILSENGVSYGSLTQYFVGRFDGSGFVSANGDSRVLWAENGPDNYAGIPYHNDPRNRTVFIGWMSNWLYGQDIPTSTWRGQMTIPRKLGLRSVDGRLHLTQEPVEELASIMNWTQTWSMQAPLLVTGEQNIDLTSEIPFKTGSMLSLVYELDVSGATTGHIGFRFGNSLGEFVTFKYHIQERVYELDRRNSGRVTFSPRFADKTYRADRIASSNLLTGRVILDTASIEVFADEGLNTFTALFFPTKPFENIQIYGFIAEESSETSVSLQLLNVTVLTSIWK